MQKKRPKADADGFAISPENRQPPPSLARELWVRPNMNLRHKREATGELNPLTSASAQKFLELANIALGLQKPATARKKPRSVLAPATARKEKGALRKTW